MVNTEIEDKSLASERIESVFNALLSTIGRIQIKAEKTGKEENIFFEKLDEKKSGLFKKLTEAKELLRTERFEKLDASLTNLEEELKSLIAFELENYSEIYAG